ncbi:MAG TPA: hypothetical protein VG166_04550 [Caulobacteraceae bacterium]|jgi:hypothetical protein|nr:hypothetical protein [Caulobacteraceae bacterium]
MLGLLFPRIIDNTLRGRRLGYWLLVPVLAMKFAIALGSLLHPAGASQADGIDVSTYSPAALREAAASTALNGLLHLAIALFCLLAMIRYRALTPLVWLWLLAEFLARRLVLEAYPIDRVGGTSSGSIINLALITMMTAGLALSLWPRREAAG